MARSKSAQRERTLELATRFLEETRVEIARAVAEGTDLPPRIRSVQDRVGHATPEYRTLAIPVTEKHGGASPEFLSAAIARYAMKQRPRCLLLAFEALQQMEGRESMSVLIAEARDRIGTRLFWMQPFRVEGKRISWEEPVEGGWQDPGGEEMILDAAFGGSAM